jgi:hypothetical protein
MILNPILMPDVPALGFECEKKEVAPGDWDEATPPRKELGRQPVRR